MQGRVAVSHAFALGSIAPDLFAKTADALARAEVAIMTSCPPSAPVPPPAKLRARGVTVFAGSDNIRDCWSPYGNGDMLDRAAIIAERHALFTDRELEDAFALTTSEADKALGAPPHESFAPARSLIWSQSQPPASPTRSSIGLRARWCYAPGASRPSEASPPRRSRTWWSPEPRAPWPSRDPADCPVSSRSVAYRSADEHGRGPRFLLDDLRVSLGADRVEA